MTTHLFDLTGKTALVTGAAQGLGLAMAIGLAQAGARVVLNNIPDAAPPRVTGWRSRHASRRPRSVGADRPRFGPRAAIEHEFEPMTSS